MTTSSRKGEDRLILALFFVGPLNQWFGRRLPCESNGGLYVISHVGCAEDERIGGDISGSRFSEQEDRADRESARNAQRRIGSTGRALGPGTHHCGIRCCMQERKCTFCDPPRLTGTWGITSVVMLWSDVVYAHHDEASRRTLSEAEWL